MTSYDYERSKKITLSYLGAIPLLAFALIFILSTAFQSLNRIFIHKNGIYATGVVYDIEELSNTDMDTFYFKVKFSYNNHEYYIANQNRSGDSDRYYLNEKVRVGFQRDSPEKAIIDDSREQEYFAIVPLAIGLIILYFAFSLIRNARKPILRKVE
jgi:hypothetical protein